jgi:4-hydroxy-tetrahydrodipicolinate synthase
VVTPFTEDGALDFEAFCENLDLLIDEGITGAVVAGHTGETWAIGDEERSILFEKAVETAKGRAAVVAGVSAIRTEHAVEYAKMAKAAGADGVLLTAPAYAIVNDREVVAHFEAVSNTVDIPIMIYNIPRRVGRELKPYLIERLAEVDTVVALKQSSPSFDEVGEAIYTCGDKLRIFTGSSAERGLPGVAVGVDGFISSVETQVLGEEAINLYELSVQGELDEARRVQKKCAALTHALHAYGTAPAAQKAVMNHLGRPGGYPRAPILPLTDKEFTALMEEVRPILAE